MRASLSASLAVTTLLACGSGSGGDNANCIDPSDAPVITVDVKEITGTAIAGATVTWTRQDGTSGSCEPLGTSTFACDVDFTGMIRIDGVAPGFDPAWVELMDLRDGCGAAVPQRYVLELPPTPA